MKNYHANGWQDFSVKKDIEKIVRNTAQTKIVNTGIIVDFVLLLVGIIIEQSVPTVTDNAKKIYIFFLLVIAVISVSSIWVEQLIFYIKERSVRLKHRIKNFVDSFDNEICYYVMMSKSFQDLLDKCNAPEDINIKIFYYTEMCFYRNKAIRELFKMIQSLHLVFDEDAGKVRAEKKISIFRLENIMKLINEINVCIESNNSLIDVYSSKDVLLAENNIRLDNFTYLNDEIKEKFNIDCIN